MESRSLKEKTLRSKGAHDCGIIERLAATILKVYHFIFLADRNFASKLLI